MQDPFADALGDDNDGEFDITGPEMLQLAADALWADEGYGSVGAPLGADPLDPRRVGPLDLKRQRLSAQKKGIRRLFPRKQLKLQAVKECNGSAIRCIFVPRNQGKQEAIPLWPQYKAQWKDANFKSATWLAVSNLSRWVQQVIKVISSCSSTQRIAQHMFSAVRAEFKACLRVANGQEHEDATSLRQSTDHEDSDSESTALLRLEKKDAAVTVAIAGYSLLCMNTSRQMLVAVDDAAVDWIRHWLVPLAKRSASNIGAKASKAVKKHASKIETHCPGFKFIADPTPNINGKISWNPKAHAWNVVVLKPRMMPFPSFAVDPALPDAQYLIAKSMEYRRAIYFWNKCEGGKRFRIKLQSLLRNEKGNTSGSQPSIWLITQTRQRRLPAHRSQLIAQARLEEC